MESNIQFLSPSALERADAQRAHASRLAEQQERSDVVWLMSGQRGRRVVWRWLEQAGVFRHAFAADAMTMAFAEGCRNGGLRMLAAVHALPEYALMVAENAPALRAAPAVNDEQEAA